MRSSLFALLLLALSACILADAEEERDWTRGIVEQVQLVVVEGLEDSEFLILELEDGGSFQIPGARQLSAGAGVKVEVESLPVVSPGELPVACRVRVLAVPLEIDGEEVLQEAANPFEVYAADECVRPGSGNRGAENGEPEALTRK